MQTSKLSLELSPVDVQSVLEKVKQLITTYPKNENVRIYFEDNTFGQRVLASQVPLQQVLLNLITNSLKVMLKLFTHLANLSVHKSWRSKNHNKSERECY